jgi:hypothetical protein
VLAYSWPLLAAAWVAATVHTRHALLSAGLAILGFGDLSAGKQAVASAARHLLPFGWRWKWEWR